MWTTETNLGTVRVLVQQFGGSYMAQCLEVAIAAEGRTLKELEESLEYMFRAHIELAKMRGYEPFSNLPQAPDHYHQMWEEAFSRQLGDSDFKIQHEHGEITFALKAA